ncbi:MAG: B12-binding domain-containing radical SAM protein [Magnetococcales bacterium]|nr:B12-binding domain-containing radical SAM protein [Magnetococcales bacterium]
MKTTLLAPCPPDISAFGVRMLSAFLKEHGQEVRVIYLPGGVAQFQRDATVRYGYEQRILDQVIELCRDSGLIGISFMSNYLDRAMNLGENLRKALDIPVVVGGIHPTVKPEDCLEFADLVCVGEGEDALLELIERLEKGESYDDVQNFWMKKEDGRIIRNPSRPLREDLDSLPFFDFGMEEHYIFDNFTNDVVPVTDEIMTRVLPMEPHLVGTFSDAYDRTRSYKTLSSRGCPHKCSFCTENSLNEMYSPQRYFRRRTVNHIIDELVEVKEKMPYVESFYLFDDTFLARPTREIKEFAEAYQKRVAIPFHVQVSPSTVNEEKIEALVDAGMVFVEMGVQTISEAGTASYNRKVSKEKITKAANIIYKFRDKLHTPCFHVILDNPWESPQDVAETIRFLTTLPPFWLQRSTLTYFPGIHLYDRAKAEGIIKTEEDEWREIYAKPFHAPESTYVNFLMYLMGFPGFPRPFMRFLASETMVRLLHKNWNKWLFSLMFRCGEGMILVSKGFNSLLRGDLYRIRRYFVRVT